MNLPHYADSSFHRASLPSPSLQQPSCSRSFISVSDTVDAPMFKQEHSPTSQFLSATSISHDTQHLDPRDKMLVHHTDPDSNHYWYPIVGARHLKCESFIPSTPFCEDFHHPERGIAGFVSKLYRSLQAPDDGQKYAHWCKQNGIDMFIIDCIPKFTEVVLPRLFKHCKFPSFVRQLNIYGFQRDTDARKSKDNRDKETCRWYHPYFRPGRRDLFHLIRRKTPQYTRRKRAKVQKDLETVLNVGSEEESELNEDTHLHSPQATSSEVSETKVSDKSTQQKYRIQASHSNSGIRSSSSISSSLSPLQQQRLSHPLSLTCDDSFDEPHGEQFHQTQLPELEASSQLTLTTNTMDTAQVYQEIAIHPDCNKSLTEPISPSSHDSSEHANQGMTQQDKLQAQLLQMQRAHRDMHEYYKDKMTKAYNQMAAQQLRIEQLESILRSVQFPMNHYHTTSYTNSMIIDKQQQQQQQQQYGHYERMQMSHGAGNPTFGATNMLQPGIPPSTGNVPHSYFLSSTGETTPPMSNDDQLTDDVLNTTLTSAVTAAKEQEPSHSSFSAWMQSPLPHTDTPSVPVTMIDTHATDIAVQHHYAPARYSLEYPMNSIQSIQYKEPSML